MVMRNTNGLLINELMRASISGVLFFYAYENKLFDFA